MYKISSFYFVGNCSLMILKRGILELNLIRFTKVIDRSTVIVLSHHPLKSSLFQQDFTVICVALNVPQKLFLLKMDRK